jgi:hypothetical protein
MESERHVVNPLHAIFFKKLRSTETDLTATPPI